MKDRKLLTPGDAYHYRNKFEELEADHIRLKELYGQQQGIIEDYMASYEDMKVKYLK